MVDVKTMGYFIFSVSKQFTRLLVKA